MGRREKDTIKTIAFESHEHHVELMYNLIAIVHCISYILTCVLNKG